MVQEFEPRFDPATFSVLIAAVLVPFSYWWLITVPEARLNLSRDKRMSGGETREYLAKLRESGEDRPIERWFFSKWLQQFKARSTKDQYAAADAARNIDVSSGVLDQDANTSMDKPTRDGLPLSDVFRPASLRGNATPRFWSGDNPILVTMGLLLSAGIVDSLIREQPSLVLDGCIFAAGLIFGISRLGMI